MWSRFFDPMNLLVEHKFNFDQKGEKRITRRRETDRQMIRGRKELVI